MSINKTEKCNKGIKPHKFRIDKYDTCKDAKSPFIHKFRTNKNCYIYDVNTMRIIRVDSILWKIITDIGILSKEEILLKYSARYDSEKLSKVLDEIEHSQEKIGLFLNKRPEIVFPLTVENIKEELSKRTLLTLAVTENCNFNCSYCVYSGKYTNRHQWSKQNMDWDVAKRAIDDHMQHRNPERLSIAFYGGEPLMNLPLIKKCVKYIRKRTTADENVRFLTTTNGSLLSGETADFLAKEDFRLLVSLDGPKEYHDRYRRFKNGLPTWRKVFDNIKTFVEKYPHYKNTSKFELNCILAPPVDISRIESFFKTCDLHDGFIPNFKTGYLDIQENTLAFNGDVVGADAMHSEYIDNLAKGNITCETMSNNEYQFQSRFFESNYVKFHKRYTIYGCPMHNHRKRFPNEFCLFSTCIPGARRLYVSTNGAYLPCERVPESDYFRIGNVWDGLDYSKIHQLLSDWVDLSKNECKYCWCLSTCQVGCWQGIRDSSNMTVMAKKEACAKHRWRMDNLIINYCTVLEKNPHAFDFSKNIDIH